MEMLHSECLAHGPMRARIDPLPPQAGMSIPRRRVIEGLAIGRPVCPVFRPFFRDLDPSALRNRLRSIERCDRDYRPIRLNSSCETDPAIVGGEVAVKQIVRSVLQYGSLLTRGNVKNVDLIWTTGKY